MNLLDKALIAYLQARELNASSQDIYYHLGVTYGKMNQLTRAHHNLGIFFRLKGERKKALFHFETALKFPELDDKEKKALFREIESISKMSGTPRFMEKRK